jgi:uncharacterized membrane protein YcaP (DUF421 family)
MNSVWAVFDSALGLSKHSAFDLSTAQMCLRALAVYILLIGYVRFGKKRFLGEATAFDAILVIVIGSLASRAVTGTAPFVPTMAATFMFVAIHWAISYVAQDSQRLSTLVKGHDTVLVRNAQVDRHALRHAHMSDDDLEEDLRQRGVDTVAAVKEARLERSGRVSVIRK